ncbi:MAG TPA: aldehyde dehydrogenase family protein [Phycisphaerales bacterium]|nr:aldehyde dehydrogenase family protein [Phycisphaerales bacterium]
MSGRLAVAKTYKLFINGGFPRSESGRSVAVKGKRGGVFAHVCQGSRKDLRDAVEAARAGQKKWGDATAYNRGQVMYRMAEMLEGKAEEFAQVLSETTGETPAGAKRQVQSAVDRLVCFAGWTDKFAQVLGCNNPVAGPYYNFTIPEATGVIGAVMGSAGKAPALLGMITLISAPMCAGNAVVLCADERCAVTAAVLGEVCATSDVPAGVVNIVTGKIAELREHLAKHREVDGIFAAGVSEEDAEIFRGGAAENLKRVRILEMDAEEWMDAEACGHPWMIEPFVEMKTVWHPSST